MITAEKPKALMLASTASMIDQFNMSNISLLLELGYDVDVACNCVNGNTIPDLRVKQMIEKLHGMGVNVHHIEFPRSIFRLCDIYAAYEQVQKLLNCNDYKLMHCHAPISSVIARLAARKARKYGTKVIYTAHGFHFYKGAPWLNWLVYYPVEWFCSLFTDVLVTINQEDYALAKQHMHAKEIHYIPGVGIDLKKFKVAELTTEERDRKRVELGVQSGDKMLLSVGELNKNKNHEVVIRAIAKLQNKQVKYFIAGKGALDNYLEKLIADLGLVHQVKLLGYRRDIDQLLQLCDLFIHPSLREGFSIATAEAIACKVSVICADVRGPRDFVCANALFNPKDVDSVIVKINEYLVKDEDEINKNYLSIQESGIKNILEDMRRVYEGMEVE